MEITKKQIEEIQKYLTKNGIKNYIDFNNELLDHLSSDVENLMIHKNYSFDFAFETVKLKWNKQFKQTHNWLHFGKLNIAPKIIIDKAVKINKNTGLYLFLLYLLILFSSKRIAFNLTENQEIYINYSIKFIMISFVIAYVSMRLNLRRSKIKTVYSFIAKTQLMPFVFLITSLPFNKVLNSKGHIQGGIILSFYAIIYITYSLIMYRKHLQIIKNPQQTTA